MVQSFGVVMDEVVGQTVVVSISLLRSDLLWIVLGFVEGWLCRGGVGYAVAGGAAVVVVWLRW